MNDIMDDCLQLLISKNSSAFDLSANNFKVYSTTNESLRYLQEDLIDHTYFRAILEMSNKVAEV